MELKDRLIALRSKKRIYQKEVADFLHVSVSSISNYEKGIHTPDLKTMISIAEYFDVSLDYLVGRVDQDVSFESLYQDKIDSISFVEFTDRAKALTPCNKQLLLHYLTMLEQTEPQNEAVAEK